MSFIRVEMWSGNKKLLLNGVLERLQLQEPPEWRLLEFSGSGVAPDNRDMASFERDVRSVGYHFSTEGLKKFSDRLTDVSEVKLIGAFQGRNVVEINGYDSQFWEIWTDDYIAKLLD